MTVNVADTVGNTQTKDVWAWQPPRLRVKRVMNVNREPTPNVATLKRQRGAPHYYTYAGTRAHVQ